MWGSPRAFEQRHVILRGIGRDARRRHHVPELLEQAWGIRKKYGVQNQDVVFSFVGRIVRDKGIAELTAAFQQVRQRVGAQRFFLMLIGDFETDLDPLPAEVMAFLKTDNAVILPGFQSDIRPWVLASDIFVFPSYREGFPNVVMQASLLQIPCIVSDINGCNEIVENEKTGLIVPSKEVDLLITAMIALSENATRRRELGEKACEFVKTHFKREYIWEALSREYFELLSRANQNQL